MTTTVSLEKCAEYQFDSVYTSLKKLIKDVPPPDVTGKTVLLKPNDSTFVTDAEGKKAINESEIVEYNRVKPNYYKKDNGGGSFGVFGLIMLMLSAVLLKRRKV